MRATGFFLFVLIGVACGDTSSDYVAKLDEITRGSASKAVANAAWKPASAGDRFRRGDALRTETASEASLRYRGQSMWMGPETVVYFSGKNFDFEGELELGEAVFSLGIEFGLAELSDEGKLRLEKRGNRLSFEILFGMATLIRDGERSTLDKGDGLYFDLGDGSVDRMQRRVEDAAPAEAAVLDAGTADANGLDAGHQAETSGPVSLVIRGSGAKRRDSDNSPWKALRPGEHAMSGGTELMIPKRAQAMVARGSERVELEGPADATIGHEGEPLVTLHNGKAIATIDKGESKIAVPGGIITLRSEAGQGISSIHVDKRSSQVRVQDGLAELGNRDGEKVSAYLGDAAELTHGGELRFLDNGPRVAHMSLVLGEQVTIHTPGKSVNLRIDFSAECADGVVELVARAKQRRQGRGGAILKLGRGVHRYQVRCYENGRLAKRATRTGTVRIDRQAGTRPLPTGAPNNSVDADGRRYTVLYPNRPPAMRFHWPDAPASAPYKLHIVPGKGRPAVHASTLPEKGFASGEFGEGDYEFWFESKGIESERTHLHIGFDNAASSGYLISPAGDTKLQGKSVRVAGAALEGWTVSVAGKKLVLDPQHRFDTRLAPTDEGTLAVRFFHPQHGAHLYLRGAP